ncbi:MAG: hypothetical protein HYW79_00460 [Parcubacteria group bacterium]|nr:hypothetical protein [Parcubacteria group bacterium]
MAKPRKIVVAADDKKRFSQQGVIEALKRIAEKQGWSLGFAVWAASEVVKPRMPADVTVAEIEAATAEIISRGKREKAEKDGSSRPANDDRLLFDSEMQADWDAGLYKGQATVRGIRQRFAAEAKDGVEITRSMFRHYLSELAAEKAAIAELVAEQPDPDPLVAGKKMPCATPRHRGYNEPVELTQRFLLERGDDGKLHRRQHGKGDGGDIVAGELLRADAENFPWEIPPGEIPPGVVKIEEAGKTLAYGIRCCGTCRSEALEDFRARKDLPQDHPDWVERRAVLTFYTVAGLRLVVKREAESAGRVSQARSLEGGAANRRTFGAEFGTHKSSDWKRDRARGKK